MTERFDFVILGMGKTAKALVKYCFDNRYKVCLSEKRRLSDDEKEFLAKFYVPFEEGGHTVSFLDKADYIVPSPSVRWDNLSIEPERVISEFDIGFDVLKEKNSSAKIIAITGTNGKTTTVSMLEWMLRKSGYKCCACGNIGVPFIEVVNKDVDFFVVEASSFQLFSSRWFCPDVFVVLNITEDHLDWHKGMDEYVWSKLSLINPVMDDGGVVIVDKMITTWLDKFSIESEGIYFVDGWDRNLSYSVCKLIFSSLGLNLDESQVNISEFLRPDFRMQKVLEKNGVLFINDSKATNPASTVWAIRQLVDYKAKILLICGGRNKGLDLSLEDDLLDLLKVVIAFGESRYEIDTAVGGKIDCYKYVVLSDAVKKAISLAEEGDVVLFSPMCCSFDQYKNYVERGKHFNELVKEMVSSFI